MPQYLYEMIEVPLKAQQAKASTFNPLRTLTKQKQRDILEKYKESGYEKKIIGELAKNEKSQLTLPQKVKVQNFCGFLFIIKTGILKSP